MWELVNYFLSPGIFCVQLGYMWWRKTRCRHSSLKAKEKESITDSNSLKRNNKPCLLFFYQWNLVSWKTYPSGSQINDIQSFYVRSFWQNSSILLSLLCNLIPFWINDYQNQTSTQTKHKWTASFSRRNVIVLYCQKLLKSRADLCFNVKQ